MSLCAVQKAHLEARRGALTRNRIGRHLDVELPNLQNREEEMSVLQPPCSVTVARAHRGGQRGPDNCLPVTLLITPQVGRKHTVLCSKTTAVICLASLALGETFKTSSRMFF